MLLEVDSLRAGYGEVPVLHGVSIHVSKGERVAVLGANGAGKSTLFRSLFGHAKVSAGRLRFDGLDLRTSTADAIARAGLVHVPEGRGLFPGLTVRENLLVPCAARKELRRFPELLDQVVDMFPRLGQRMRQVAGTMSGGEQQMLAIARGLIAEPALIVFDEPSIGLAPALVDEVVERLGAISEAIPDLSILLVEQSAEHALAICDRGYVLDRGNIVLEASSADLSNAPALVEALTGIRESG